MNFPTASPFLVRLLLLLSSGSWPAFWEGGSIAGRHSILHVLVQAETPPADILPVTRTVVIPDDTMNNLTTTPTITPPDNNVDTIFVCPPSDVDGVTPVDALGPFYIANSPLTNRIAPESELSDPNRRLTVQGRVFSTKNPDCGNSNSSMTGSNDTQQQLRGVSNLVVEFWYAGGSDGSYDDSEYRGQVVTDACGAFTIVQTFPGVYAGRPLHNHVRVSTNTETTTNTITWPNGTSSKTAVPLGSQLLVTQMYFNGTEPGYVNARSTSRSQLQVVDVWKAGDDADGVAGGRWVEFNVYLNNVDGTADTSSSDCSVPSPPTTPWKAPVVTDVEPIPSSTPTVAASPPTTMPPFSDKENVNVVDTATTTTAAPGDQNVDSLVGGESSDTSRMGRGSWHRLWDSLAIWIMVLMGLWLIHF